MGVLALIWGGRGKRFFVPTYIVVYLAAYFALAGVGIAYANSADANSAAALHAQYDLLKEKLSHNLLHNLLKKPLYMESRASSGAVAGEIYGLINHPFGIVNAALNAPVNWCDILILHLNIKSCRAAAETQGSILKVHIGKKYDQPLDKSYRVNFAFHVAVKTLNYLQVSLNADKGPISTRNYRIMFEAVPLNDKQTFIHFSFSYAYGLTGRIAMQAYLNTIGRSKVGFTVIGQHADGQPIYIDGMRGLVERNAMRYYLAIEVFLSTLSVPPQKQLEKRLHDWFTAVEAYPRQLHELEQQKYLEMKLRSK